MLDMMDNIKNELKDDVNVRYRTFGDTQFKYTRTDPYGLIHIKVVDSEYVPVALQGQYTSFAMAIRDTEQYVNTSERKKTEKKKD